MFFLFLVCVGFFFWLMVVVFIAGDDGRKEIVEL